MNLPEASQDAILGRANLFIVTWKGISGQMPLLRAVPQFAKIIFFHLVMLSAARANPA
jgi:hypothetical protein